MTDYHLPKCPEICHDCTGDSYANMTGLDSEHVAHFEDELAHLTISLSEDGHHFIINGVAEAGDLFWLLRILKQAANSVEKQWTSDEPAEETDDQGISLDKDYQNKKAGTHNPI